MPDEASVSIPSALSNPYPLIFSLLFIIAMSHEGNVEYEDLTPYGHRAKIYI